MKKLDWAKLVCSVLLGGMLSGCVFLVGLAIIGAAIEVARGYIFQSGAFWYLFITLPICSYLGYKFLNKILED